MLTLLLETLEKQAPTLDWTPELHEALCEAAYLNNQGILEMLIKLGKADVNSRGQQGRTALHHAAQRGDQIMAELLIRHGARLDIKDSDGRTALEVANFQEHKALADWLEQKARAR